MFPIDLKQTLSQKQPLFIGEKSAFRSVVLIPLVQINAEWHVLFEVRALTMRKQPGDISFPGGKIDPTDESPLSAALRETSEELGISNEAIQVVGQLSPYVASPSFVVYPFVAVLDYDKVHNFNKDEVEQIFTVPVSWLLNNAPYMHHVKVEVKPGEDFPFGKIMNGTEYRWRTNTIEEWFYEYEDYTIWGLTARILKYFIELMK